MTRRVEWRSILAEGLVILLSILAAFALDAWWDGERERDVRRQLLSDLRTEIEGNQAQLSETLVRQRTRIGRVDLYLELLTDPSLDVAEDSMVSLRDSLWLNPTFDPAFGVLDLLIQSGELVLVEDGQLRRRLAGLTGAMNDFVSNANVLIRVATEPETLFGMGPLYGASGNPAAGPLGTATRAERRRAMEFYGFVRRLTAVMVGQGEGLHREMDEILGLLDEADIR